MQIHYLEIVTRQVDAVCAAYAAAECPDASPAGETGDHSSLAYLVVDDVDGYHRRATARGAELVKPLRDEPWGMREFGVRTPDGHRLMLGAALEEDV